ncbi:ribose ABC transporter substrate-binding protein RbsB [Paraliobacillus salinarum]|uniref:ribose ABC transporter substrate-binding protein RbsB n=1 Tax=Paraliobacillus salinarum TaxID=1158996 RepID=UPI0015F4239C|nr:ribose ABC transporter substrate-binding protein RbsB [Paraliobacillus salinarum]
MFKWLKAMAILIAAVLFLAACSTDAPGSGDAGEGEEGDGDNSVTVGFSVSTLNNPFFVSLRDGTELAAKEAGFDIITSDAQDDPTTQLSDIEDMLQQNIDVLLINPVDSEAVVSAVELANEAGVPVITVDRSADGGEVVTHVASDNVAGGEMAGEYIVSQLEEQGKLVEIEGVPGASATRERGEGFHNVIDKMNDLEMVANQTANFDRTEGLTVMENILQGTEKIDAVFAHNDEMALGALEAIESAGLSEDIIVVGFDAIDDAVKAVEDGTLDATIAQQPKLIGEEAVKAAQKIVNGDEVERTIPVELELVTNN